MFLIFDTETTGLPKNFKAPVTDTDNWPRCIQIAWQLHAADGSLIEHNNYLIQPDGFDIPFQSEKIHGISTELAKEKGSQLKEVLDKFQQVLAKSTFIVGQNIRFDLNIMGCEFYRLKLKNNLLDLPVLDTCTEKTAQLCKITGGRYGKFKLPTLTELHEFLFNEPFAEAHNATADVEATTRCFLELIKIRSFTNEELQFNNESFADFLENNRTKIMPVGIKHINLKKESNKIRKKVVKSKPKKEIDVDSNLSILSDVKFSHLHNHSQFSVLQSTTFDVVNRLLFSSKCSHIFG